MNNYEQTKDIQRSILAGLEYYQGVKLPSPQRTGTSYQIETYAFQQAQKVQEQLNS